MKTPGKKRGRPPKQKAIEVNEVSLDDAFLKGHREMMELLKEIRTILDNMWRERSPK